MSTVLLFGASGYLGRHVVRALESQPIGLRLVTPGRAACDLVRVPAAQLQETLRDIAPDVVVNCMGRLDGTSTDLIEGNTLATAKLLDALAAVPARLVRIGSAGEYGMVPVGSPVHEETPAAPVGAYGASHLAATHLVEQAYRSGRVDAVTLRVFNPIGSGLNGDTVLGRAALSIREAQHTGASHVQLGPLDTYRDFVDARDVADAVVAAISRTHPWATINIGSGRATSVREAVRMLADVAGYHGDIVEASASSGRSAGVTWIQADIGRARDALGWYPRHGLAESLGQIWHDVAATQKRPNPGAIRINHQPAVTSTRIVGAPR
jgi:nucleoside-diphosphate-sugar epimerase